MAIDAFGNVKQVKAGNDVTTSRVYDTLGRVTAIDTEHFGETIQNLNYVYDSVGNMKSREDVRDPSNVFYEEFTYDAVNRLDTVKAQTGSTPLIQTMGFEYDEGGRISDFNGNIYDYSVDSVHGVDSISGNSNKTFVYDANGNQTNSDGRTLIYSAFNKTTSMFNGGASVDFVYGSDNKRIKRIDTGNDENETTYYVGNVEFITNNLTNRTKIKRYIGDTVITDYDDNTQEVKYLHKDHLGSVQSVTSKDFDTNTTQHLSFDAFGRRRDASNNTSIIVVNPIANVTKRGYTGQEHIDQLGIINFNARLYDPSLGIMLQADTIVPDGPVTQSMNRYSYVFNNPLSYTDPTGHKPFKFFSTQTEKAFAAADRHFENKREQRDNKKSENNKSVESKSTSPVEGANDGTFRGNGLGILASPEPPGFLDAVGGTLSGMARNMGNDLLGSVNSFNNTFIFPATDLIGAGGDALAPLDGMFNTLATSGLPPARGAGIAGYYGRQFLSGFGKIRGLINGVEEGVDLNLKFKANWTAAQRAAACVKCASLTAANTEVVTNVQRSGTSAASRYKSAGNTVRSGQDVDHVVDLQLNGADEIFNMSPLDMSVNRSLGSQIQHQIKNLDAGTVINKVNVSDR